MSQWTNEIAQRYDEQWGDLPLLASIADWLSLSGKERIVDIGCGSGAVLASISQKHPDCQLYGCDPMSYMVQKAQARVPHAIIEQANAESFTASSIDLALAANTLRHWTSVKRGLNHIASQECRTIVLVDDLAFNPSDSEFCPAINAALAWFASNDWKTQISQNQEFSVSIIRATL